MKRVLSVLIICFVFVILVFLPIVPISIAPVVPNPTYSFRMAALIKILWFAIARPDGVSYQYHWYTYAIIFTQVAIGCVVSVFIFRKIRETSHD